MYDPRDIAPRGNFDETFEDKPAVYRRYRDAFIGVDGEPRKWEECAKWAATHYGFSTMIDEQIGQIIDEGESRGLASMRERLPYHAEKFQDPLLTWMRNLFVTRGRDYTEYGADYRAR